MVRGRPALIIYQKGRSSTCSASAVTGVLLEAATPPLFAGCPPESDLLLPSNCTSRTRSVSETPCVLSCLLYVLTSGEPSTNTWVPLVRYWAIAVRSVQ